ncbi:hypothetical protein, partial [Aureimonas sp. D3]|uniref:hypothetical protein n=1 Tax=Aureimonas sp. D3 TaxID=1638164 RepID=UPI001AEC2201
MPAATTCGPQGLGAPLRDALVIDRETRVADERMVVARLGTRRILTSRSLNSCAFEYTKVSKIV